MSYAALVFLLLFQMREYIVPGVIGFAVLVMWVKWQDRKVKP